MDSKTVLRRLHQAIAEVIKPAWVANLHPEIGLPHAGTPKADTCRTIQLIHLPLTLISLWGEDSPLATDDANTMSSVLDTSLWLTCALIHMTRDTLTAERREAFRNAYYQHVLGLRANFPGFFMLSHHLAFHIPDFMDQFSTVRNWWAFFFSSPS